LVEVELPAAAEHPRGVWDRVDRELRPLVGAATGSAEPGGAS
jgi:hypothetical protein